MVVSRGEVVVVLVDWEYHLYVQFVIVVELCYHYGFVVVFEIVVVVDVVVEEVRGLDVEDYGYLVVCDHCVCLGRCGHDPEEVLFWVI